MKKIFLISALIPAAAIAMADITVNSPHLLRKARWLWKKRQWPISPTHEAVPT